MIQFKSIYNLHLMKDSNASSAFNGSNGWPNEVKGLDID